MHVEAVNDTDIERNIRIDVYTDVDTCLPFRFVCESRYRHRICGFRSRCHHWYGQVFLFLDFPH